MSNKDFIINFDSDTSDDSEADEYPERIDSSKYNESDSSEEQESLTPSTWKDCAKVENAMRTKIMNHALGSSYIGSDANLGTSRGGTTVDGSQSTSTSRFEDPLGFVNKDTPGLEDFYHEGFIPKKFLATVHKSIEYNKLINGHQLAKKHIFRQHQMEGLVSNNLSRFIKAKSTVSELNDRKSDNTDKRLLRLDDSDLLSHKYTALQNNSRDLFGNMIQRKKRTESIKEVLNIFKKYQYILDIPTNIAHNILKEDYNQVIYDYRKAKYFKQLLGENTSEIHLFAPIFQKVDQQIADLRTGLLDKLLNHEDFENISLKIDTNRISEGEIIQISLLDEERERIIAHLLSLDSQQDPAWYYLNRMYEFIQKYLENLAANYMNHARSIQIAYLEKDSRTAIPKKYKKLKMTSQELRSMKKLNFTIEEVYCQFVKCLEKVMVYYLDSFWTLSQNIINDKYKPDVESVQTSTSASASKSELLSRIEQIDVVNMQKKAIEERKIQYEEKIKQLFSNIIETYIKNCEIALEEVDYGQTHPVAKCKCVQSIVSCHFSLEEKIAIQKAYLTPMKRFTFAQHKNIIATVWERCIRAIRRLRVEEDWRQISETFQITQLPQKLFNYIRQVLILMKPFMELKSKNNAKSPFFGLVESKFCECITEFAECQHDLAFDIPSSKVRELNDEVNSDSDDDYEISQPPLQFSYSMDLDMNESQSDGISAKEQKLILILRNIIHTKTVIVPNLVRQMLLLDTSEENLRKDLDKFHNSTQSINIDLIYDGLTTMILNSFTRRKTIHLLKYIQDAMRNTITYQPNGLRTYALELLLELSLIHSRFENIASGSLNNSKLAFKSFTGVNIDEFLVDKEDTSSSRIHRDETLTSRIFESLCERIAELFMEFLVELEREYMTENDALQLVIEITFIRNTLKKYENERAEKIYNHLFQLIEQLSPYDSRSSKNVKFIKEVLKDVASKTRLQLESLRA